MLGCSGHLSQHVPRLDIKKGSTGVSRQLSPQATHFSRISSTCVITQARYDPSSEGRNMEQHADHTWHLQGFPEQPPRAYRDITSHDVFSEVTMPFKANNAPRSGQSSPGSPDLAVGESAASRPAHQANMDSTRPRREEHTPHSPPPGTGDDADMDDSKSVSSGDSTRAWIGSPRLVFSSNTSVRVEKANKQAGHPRTRDRRPEEARIIGR